MLDEDHYDLEKIKDRILEYLAVRKLKRMQRREADEEPPRRTASRSSASSARRASARPAWRSRSRGRSAAS